jgi:hypothetical protein
MYSSGGKVKQGPKVKIGGLEVEVNSVKEIQDEGCVMVVVRLADAGPIMQYVPGTKAGYPCHLCGADCILAPSGQELVAAGKNPVQCIQCTVKLARQEKPD